MRYPYLDHDGPLAFAHRGGAGVHPENTIEAFAHSVDLGFRYLETDVHVTADGVAVAFHDAELDRVSDARGTIASWVWRDLQSVEVGSGGRISRLDDLLGAFPDARFNLDPKADASVDGLVRAIGRTDSIDRVAVGSFSDRRIAEVRRRVGPRLCTSAGPRATVRGFARSRGLPISAPDTACYQVPVRFGRLGVVDRRFVAAAHRSGMHVHVWTIDDPTEMHRLLDLGVDGIMTDLPDVLRSVLVDRGTWPR